MVVKGQKLVLVSIAHNYTILQTKLAIGKTSTIVRKKKIGDASLWPIKLITYVGDFPLKIEAHYLAKKETFAILINGYEYMTYQFTAMVGDSQDVM